MTWTAVLPNLHRIAISKIVGIWLSMTPTEGAVDRWTRAAGACL